MNKKEKLEEQAKLDKMTKYDRKKYLRTKKEKEDKKKRIIYTIAAILGVIGCVVLVFVAKESQRRINYETYATVGNTEISRLEFDYYYCMNVNNWLNNNYYYLSYYGIDPSKDLSTQIKDEKTKETWQDYFVSNTKELVTNIFSLYEDAVKNNYSDWEDDYTNFIKNVKEMAKTNDMSYMEYVKAYYGNSLSQKDFEEYSKRYCMVSSYDEQLYDSFHDGVTDEDISKLYNENKNDYDTVDYLMFTMSIAEEKEITDAMKKELKDKVTNTVTAIKDKETFIAQAKEKHSTEHETTEFTEDSIVYKAIGISNAYTTDCGKWLFAEERKAGEVISISDSSETTYYILYYVGRKLDTEKTVNLRIIYESFVADDKDTDKTLNKAEAEKKIKEIADKYTLDGANEAIFEKLAIENGFTDGGLNQYVSKDALVVEGIKEWAFDEKREESDIKILTEDDVVYLLYYISDDVPYYQIKAKGNITQERYDEYLKNILSEIKISE